LTYLVCRGISVGHSQAMPPFLFILYCCVDNIAHFFHFVKWGGFIFLHGSLV
jgi:hypothetical protein